MDKPILLLGIIILVISGLGICLEVHFNNFELSGVVASISTFGGVFLGFGIWSK